eukprot:TRINITY_DN4335_c1_g1_i1.p1 TRINITY_DN4335_c1_g1~~TRINITY_DN4335_c1_g1_i1.p1  ORF type:complete len:454 (-),score=82.74 TRINITY_DN4335_c1_g1_i1:23-1384(-)
MFALEPLRRCRECGGGGSSSTAAPSARADAAAAAAPAPTAARCSEALRCRRLRGRGLALASAAALALSSLAGPVQASEADEAAALRAENNQLRSELARLRAAAAAGAASGGGNSSSSSPASPWYVSRPHDHAYVPKGIHELALEEAQLLAVVVLLFLIFLLPVLPPLKRCCETRLNRVYPILTLVNFAILCFVLNLLSMLSFNQAFFAFVHIAEAMIDQTEQLLMGAAAFLIVAVCWRFKDRVLEALGVENPAHYLGEPRDWATCWSMKRFQPIELLILKIEDIPSAKLHTYNDVFCEVRHGYNVSMRTRVHNKSGSKVSFKESFQLNFDPYDKESLFTILVRNQDVFGASDIAQVQFGATQVQRLAEPLPEQRALGWASTKDGSDAGLWAPSRFKCIDLIPAGRIYIRFIPVDPDRTEMGSGCLSAFCCCSPCCWPSSSGQRDASLTERPNA